MGIDGDIDLSQLAKHHALRRGIKRDRAVPNDSGGTRRERDAAIHADEHRSAVRRQRKLDDRDVERGVVIHAKAEMWDHLVDWIRGSLKGHAALEIGDVLLCDPAMGGGDEPPRGDDGCRARATRDGVVNVCEIGAKIGGCGGAADDTVLQLAEDAGGVRVEQHGTHGVADMADGEARLRGGDDGGVAGVAGDMYAEDGGGAGGAGVLVGEVGARDDGVQAARGDNGDGEGRVVGERSGEGEGARAVNEGGARDGRQNDGEKQKLEDGVVAGHPGCRARARGWCAR